LTKNGNIIALLLLLIVSTAPVHSLELKTRLSVATIAGNAYVSLHALTDRLNLDSSFDIITGRGKIYRGSNFTVYQEGICAILLNGKLKKYRYPVTRREGELFIPVQFAIDLLAEYVPGSKITCGASSLEIVFPSPGKETPRTPETQPARDAQPSAYGKDMIRFIIIDPGHGGKDPGAIGKGGVYEKHITLEIAKKLARYLETNLRGVRVVHTRNNDTFIELGRRIDIANARLKENENGLFISIHINASISPRISGFETYVLSQNPSNEDARATAALENNVIILEDREQAKKYDDAAHMEAFMLTAQIQKESAMLAESIQSSIDATISEFKSRGVKKADFYVLRGALMPSVLVEAGYITNTRELRYLQKSGHQDKIARGIGKGIIQFINKYNAMIKK